jgi:hypothetical protein
MRLHVHDVKRSHSAGMEDYSLTPYSLFLSIAGSFGLAIGSR